MKQKKLFRLATAILIVVLTIGVANSKLYAMDKNNRYVAYGLGQRSCEDYVKFREKKLEVLEGNERYTKDDLYEIVDKIVEHWIAGFLTAHDLYVADTYDVAGKTTMNDLKGRLENICRANGKQYFAEAMVLLVQQLNPMRIATEPGK
jgi:hypothetical protein